MKKFKTKRKNNRLLFLLFIILFFILFIWISFKNLDHSYNKFLRFIFNETSFIKKDYHYSIKLNYLLNNYSFKESVKEIEKKNNIIYLYNSFDDEMYKDKTKIIDVSRLLRDNLNKLGIKVLLENDVSDSFLENRKEDITYYIKIQRGNDKDTTVSINNKKYAKILFVLGKDNSNYLNNRENISLMHDYLENNYPGLSSGIIERKELSNQDLDDKAFLIEIGNINNNYEEVSNSTEIIALMLYSILGDINE